MTGRDGHEDDSLIDFLIGLVAVLSMIFAVACVVVLAVQS